MAAQQRPSPGSEIPESQEDALEVGEAEEKKEEKEKEKKSCPSAAVQAHIAKLETQNAALRARIEQVKKEGQEVREQLVNPEAAEKTVKSHITLLQEYNAIRDVSMGLMGLVAEARGVRAVEVYTEFGVGEGD